MGRLLLCSKGMEWGWAEMVHIRAADKLVSAYLQFNLH